MPGRGRRPAPDSRSPAITRSGCHPLRVMAHNKARVAHIGGVDGRLKNHGMLYCDNRLSPRALSSMGRLRNRIWSRSRMGQGACAYSTSSMSWMVIGRSRSRTRARSSHDCGNARRCSAVSRSASGVQVAEIEGGGVGHGRAGNDRRIGKVDTLYSSDFTVSNGSNHPTPRHRPAAPDAPPCSPLAPPGSARVSVSRSAPARSWACRGLSGLPDPRPAVGPDPE